MIALGSRRAAGIALLALFPALLLVGGLWAEREKGLLDLKYAVQREPADAPSSRMAPSDEVAKGFPLVSLYTERENLYDPRVGLLTHVLEHGRDWERPAYLSYFDRGRLLFVSAVGIRIHGKQSRIESPVKSFRIYFRRRSYAGVGEFQPGLLLSPATEPLRRVIARNDLRQDPDGLWWHFTDPLAYDIAHRVGCLVPETKPVRFFLNGKPLGAYVMTEWLKDGYFDSHYPEAKLEFAGSGKIERLKGWVKRLRPLTMQEAAEIVDLDSLTRWWIAVTFCATYDVYQGVMLRDMAKGEGRWFWITWDMDHSFFRNPKEKSSVAWKQDPFDIIARQPDLRADLFRYLIEDDPANRDYAARMFVEALNHGITPEFLEERFEHYRKLGEELGVGDREYLGPLKEFLDQRPARVRAILGKRLGLGPVHRCRVVGPAEAGLEVDGYPEKPGFTGWYFDGMEIEVAAAPASRAAFSYWLVNGERVDAEGGVLRRRVTADLEIDAVF